MVAKQFLSIGVQDELLKAVELNDETPLIVFANHASWWDPIVAMLLQQAYFSNRTFYAPIDAEALEKYRIMAKLGFYGVRMESFDGASAFLKMTKGILHSKKVAILITPEGRFADVRDYSWPLMPGLSHLASKIPGVKFLPVAFEYAFWNESRPQIFVRFGSPIDSSETMAKVAWSELLTGRLRQTQTELARSVQQREPAAFQYLVESRPVRLGWYDYCRSWAAWIQGKPFDPRHSV
jgi:1-acyl-sn-glycerol-3-phosphate acyltransferase